MAEYRTKLSTKDEERFRAWYAAQAQQLGITADPDDLRHFYDYRGAWMAGTTPDKTGHWPDTFKTPGHPTFSVESIYYRPGMKAGKWEGGKYVPLGSAMFNLDDVGAGEAPQEEPMQDFSNLKVSRDQYLQYVKEYHEKIKNDKVGRREQLVSEFKKITGVDMPKEPWGGEEEKRDRGLVAW